MVDSAREHASSKEKSLAIFIDTDAKGPHGMPLVYGAATGSIRGSIRFSSNYDCKGRDIMIVYEAWTETRWTTIEHKRTVNHLTKNVFGYQTLSFPLSHTKTNGSTVVGGDYTQQFDIPLTLQPETANVNQAIGRRSVESIARFTRKSRSSSHSSSASSSPSTCPYLSSPSSSASSSSSSLHESSSIQEQQQQPLAAPLPPSSNLCPESRVKYTIRAVLRRPFPSLSNFEVSQEVWVVNTPPSTPPAVRKCPSADSLSLPPTLPAEAVTVKEGEPSIPIRISSMPPPPETIHLSATTSPQPFTKQRKDSTISQSQPTPNVASDMAAPALYGQIIVALFVSFAAYAFFSTLEPSTHLVI